MTPDLFDSDRQRVYPTRWKSLVSGTTRILRFEGDYVYADLVISDEQKRRRDFSIHEFRKVAEKYAGTFRSRFTCTYPDRWYGQPQYKQCSEEAPTELTSVTPTRIEGRVLSSPEDTKYDCRRCKYKTSEQVWVDFVWVPE